MPKYLSPLTDFGFKKIFGEESSKNSLISFLNDILPIEHKIKEVNFLASEQLGNSEEDRAAIYDIFCEDEKGGQFIVEMQNARQTYFKDRTVFYSSFPIQKQSEKGDWNFKLKPVYCVSLLGFKMPRESDDYIHRVHLKDQHNNVFYKKLSYVYVELPKFNKSIDELENHLDKWIYFLKNLESFEQLPEIFKEKVFIETLERIEFLSLSQAEKLQYERNLKNFRDNINIIDTARKEGREEGIEQGSEKELNKNIKVMFSNGVSIENIAKFLGLKLDFVKNILNR